jgi:hypothetical protein
MYKTTLIFGPETKANCAKNRIEARKAINIFPLTDALFTVKSKFMDRNCKNCEHFRRRSVMSAEHIWGHCMKPGRYSIDAEGRKRRGVLLAKSQILQDQIASADKEATN